MVPSSPLIGINCDAFFDKRGEITGIRPEYWRAVEAVGATPVLIPHLSSKEEIGRLLDRLDGVVLTGGDDLRPERLGLAECPPSVVPITPERDRTDFLLLEALLERRMPALAICLGYQELNVLLGGSLWVDLATERPDGPVAHRGGQPYTYVTHPVRVEPASLLGRLWGGVTEAVVPSAHHQAIRTLAPGLRATAWAADGLVEAFEVEGAPFFIGVQWHPERMMDDPLERKLFAALAQAAIK